MPPSGAGLIAGSRPKVPFIHQAGRRHPPFVLAVGRFVHTIRIEPIMPDEKLFAMAAARMGQHGGWTGFEGPFTLILFGNRFLITRNILIILIPINYCVKERK